MRQSLTSREKNLVLIAVAVIFCSFFVTKLVLPLNDEYNSAKAQLAQKTEELSALKQAQKAVSESELDLELVKKDLNELRRTLPVKTESAELLYYVNRAAEKTGVVLEKFNCVKEEENDKDNNEKAYPNLTLIASKVTVSGTYRQISAFLKETENLTRLTHNRVVTINEIKEPPKLEGIIEFNTFVADYAGKGFENESEIPVAAGGKPTLFKY